MYTSKIEREKINYFILKAWFWNFQILEIRRESIKPSLLVEMSKVACNGLEMCYHAFKDQIKRNSDLIVLFVHWYLVKNGFECIIDGKVNLIIYNTPHLPRMTALPILCLHFFFDRKPKFCPKTGTKTNKYTWSTIHSSRRAMSSRFCQQRIH